MNKHALLLLTSIVSCNLLPVDNESLDDFKEQQEEIVNPVNEVLMPYYTTFMESYDSINDKEAFVFFSDPHLLGYNSVLSSDEMKLFDTSFESMRNLYNALPFRFCLCGGDWLNDNVLRMLQSINCYMLKIR